MDVCSVSAIDQRKIAALKKTMINTDIIERMAAVFSAMADPGRLKILTLLATEELCVCEIVEMVSVSQSAVSHQLRILRNLRLVKSRRSGKMVFYSLKDNHIKQIVAICEEHIAEEE
ncbi:ArsR/SmtB family transcription factor [candidate division CSSED10-310 bacterium]|uniref:ArsR/SmtB family transcription factor n=1 Tax=candidate division CSSED10-310 bacterium TaxID=2855610 RepID=A0ABV6YWB1_UNCC1